MHCRHQSENWSEQYPKAFTEAENGGAEVIVIKSAKPGVFSKGHDLTANNIDWSGLTYSDFHWQL